MRFRKGFQITTTTTVHIGKDYVDSSKTQLEVAMLLIESFDGSAAELAATAERLRKEWLIGSPTDTAGILVILCTSKHWVAVASSPKLEPVAGWGGTFRDHTTRIVAAARNDLAHNRTLDGLVEVINELTALSSPLQREPWFLPRVWRLLVGVLHDTAQDAAAFVTLFSFLALFSAGEDETAKGVAVLLMVLAALPLLWRTLCMFSPLIVALSHLSGQGIVDSACAMLAVPTCIVALGASGYLNLRLTPSDRRDHAQMLFAACVGYWVVHWKQVVMHLSVAWPSYLKLLLGLILPLFLWLRTKHPEGSRTLLVLTACMYWVLAMLHHMWGACVAAY